MRRLGQQQQAAHGRHRDQQGHAQAPVQRAREALAVGADVVAGQRRQDHRTQRHTEHAQRQLQEAIGQRQPGLRAVGQLGRDDRVQQQVDLRHRGTEQGRHHQRHHLAHARMAPAPARQGQQVDALQ
ncbi:hypothetical protein G6F40_016328 [Rhizopus arrhizus]|nr:hypothetical protein G6F40_016328 [Rhizopus arrhizus]